MGAPGEGKEMVTGVHSLRNQEADPLQEGSDTKREAERDRETETEKCAMCRVHKGRRHT